MARQSWGTGFKGSQENGPRSGQAGGNGSNVWGSGFRSNHQQQHQQQQQRQQQQQQQRLYHNAQPSGRNGSRFSALDDKEENDRAFERYRSGGRGAKMQPQRQGQNQGGRGRGKQLGANTQSLPWRDVVKQDSYERPRWPLSCYAHEAHGECDLMGDVSFEELRWQQLQAVRGGASSQQLTQQWKDAQRSNDQQWQELLSARTPPSLGGPPVQRPAFNGTDIYQQQQQQLQQQFSGNPAFGAVQSRLSPSSATNSGFNKPFGVPPSDTIAVFGSQPTANPFSGSAPNMQAPFQSFSAATAAGSAFSTASQGFFGSKQGFAGGDISSSKGSRTVFGGGKSSMTSFGGGVSNWASTQATPKTDVFGASAAIPLPHQAPAPSEAAAEANDGMNAVSPGSDLSAWYAAAFQPGQIPESPPPPSVCT